jgi:hypothetical protein
MFGKDVSEGGASMKELVRCLRPLADLSFESDSHPALLLVAARWEGRESGGDVAHRAVGAPRAHDHDRDMCRLPHLRYPSLAGDSQAGQNSSAWGIGLVHALVLSDYQSNEQARQALSCARAAVQ